MFKKLFFCATVTSMIVPAYAFQTSDDDNRGGRVSRMAPRGDEFSPAFRLAANPQGDTIGSDAEIASEALATVVVIEGKEEQSPIQSISPVDPQLDQSGETEVEDSTVKYTSSFLAGDEVAPDQSASVEIHAATVEVPVELEESEDSKLSVAAFLQAIVNVLRTDQDDLS